jgi:hypothetical protein
MSMKTRRIYHPKPMGDMRDSIAIPTRMSRKESLEYIVKIASDKGSHLLMTEAQDWAELKLIAIRRIAKGLL